MNSAFWPAKVYGGPTHSSYNLARSLAKIGVSVKVCIANPNGKLRLEMELGHYIPFEEGFRVKYFYDTIIGRSSFQMMISLWKDIRSA